MTANGHAVTLMALACLGWSAGCSSASLSRLTRPPTPHEAYATALRDAGLDATALGRDWFTAAARPLEQPLQVALPLLEAGYFAPDEASAVAYRFSSLRGRRLEIAVSFESLEPGRLFVDLFRVATDVPRHVVSVTVEQPTLSFDVDEDGDYLLRVQPELLRGGRFDLAIRTLASLPFPVSGRAGRQVQSGYGVERDAGARRHEGVDIFAPAGTPVVAVVRGIAEPSTNTLGGNVVWLRDASRRRTYYYAHLSDWAIERATAVGPGQVLGFVGNTGNARTTAPHLHFGVYDRTPIDPSPFLAADQTLPSPPAIDPPLGALARVRTEQAALSRGSSGKSPVAASLPRATLVTVAGAAGRMVRVITPDGAVGYLPRAALADASSPLSRRSLDAGATILEKPTASAPAIRTLDAPEQVDVLGRFGGYELVRGPMSSGWVVRAGLRE